MKHMLNYRLTNTRLTTAPSCALVILSVFFVPLHPRARAAVVLPKVEKAILAEDWKQVDESLRGGETNSTPATSRLIRGHACLALNQNNESFRLFLSFGSQPERAGYEEWASSFAARNPDKAIAHYFKGDALARQTNWNAAVAAFDAAIKLNPKHTLALNARGVVHAYQDEVPLAKKDFLEAIRVGNGALADAHANAGYLWIQRKDGAKGALEAFRSALEKSPKFALALHGKGCVELITRNFQDAAIDLKSADEYGSAFIGLLFKNQARYAVFASDSNPDELLADLNNPGMSLRVQSSRDSLINDTVRLTETATRIRDMSFIPFNQHIANFFGNRAVERVEQLNKLDPQNGVADLAKGAPAQVAILRAVEIPRVSAWNADSGGGKIYIESAKIAGGLALGQAVRSAAVPVTAAGLAAGGIATQEGALVADSWRNFHKENLPSVITTLDKTKNVSPALGTIANPAANPSGVSASVKFQDGNWPFVPLYGLAYTQAD